MKGSVEDVEFSVVIPTRNEEESIEECIKKVKKVIENHRIKGEIIVADNSTDRTPEIAKKLGIKVLKPDKLGYGYAFLYGFRHANGKYIVMGDGDATYDFLEIPKLLEPIKKGEADIVIGSRFKGKILKGAMPWLHSYIGNPILTFFLNFFFKQGVSDAHSGFRAFSREALEKMKMNTRGMEFASEMFIKAVQSGLRIKEVPITYYPRKGKSKLSSFSDGWRHLKLMLLYTPKHLFLIPGQALLLFGILMMLLSSFHVYIGFTPGLHSMIAGSFSIIVGYNIFMLALIAGVYAKRNYLFEIDKITEAIVKHLSLRRGLVFGFATFALGFVHLLYLILSWTSSGFRELPIYGNDMIGFTLVVIGLQTIFLSFLLSLLRLNLMK